MNQAINTCITGLNNIGQVFWDYAAGIFIQVSVLIILLLIVDFMLRKRVRAVFRYCLWMLLFVKLVLPASFTLPTGIGYWLGDYLPSEASIAKFVPQTEEAVPVAINIPKGYIFLEPPMMNETAATGIELEPICWQGLVFLGWLVGMLVLLVLLVRRICFVRGLIAQSRPANERSLEMLDECCCRIGIRRNIELRLSGNTLSPAVCGLFKPIIIIPAALLKKLSREKLKAVLIHELAHIKRGDGWVNLLQTMLQIVYFYNPLVWIANAMIRRVREQAVDEMVLVTLRPETKNYSNMLIDIAEMAFWKPNFSLRIIGVVESKKALERRINHMLTRPVPKSSKLGYLGLIAIVVIGSVILPMGYNPNEQTALAASRIADKKIVPGVRVGGYTFDMTEDDVLESLGKPNFIFYGDKRFTLDNLPRHYYMSFGDISFRIHNDSVKEITVLSPNYKFANGLGVGDSEQKIKQAFGDDFQLKESVWKDFLAYEDKGIVFEINKQDRRVMEINVSPMEASKSYKTTADIVSKIIVPGIRVGDYTFNMTKDDVLESLGKPGFIFYGENRYTLDNLPEKYYMPYDDVSFRIVDDSVKEITVLSPSYKFADGLGVGDSEQKIKKAFGKDFKIEESKWKDFLSYKDKGLMFEINKQDRTVMEINVSPVPGSESYKKADIPPTSTINEQGRIVDKIDYPFINDPKVIGTWKSVDFVSEINQFNPAEKSWRGDLYLKELIFKPNGKTFKPWWTWTKGLVFHSGSKTASKYTLKDIEGSTYMFFEWKSGDYTIRYMKPAYYVLKKVSSETVHEPMVGEKAHIPPTSTIDEDGRIVDKIDYPFINDSQLIGTWKSVDFVGEMEQFKVGEKQWKGRGGELYLKELIFLPNGRTFKPWLTWTKGLVFHSGDKTASKYTLKDFEGSTYMFYEWKSGDYTIRYRKPSYYVLKKVSSETGGLARAWASLPGDAEFARQLPAKIEQLDIDTADLERVKKIFGKPAQYIWGKETFSEDNLPKRYIMVYPSSFCVFMSNNKIVEIRHESGFNYVFRDKLRSGSTLDEVFEVIGYPKKVVQGEENKFENGVLYKDIDGRKGHCYYARHDQDVRLWFLDYKIIAIYMTRSDYGE
jgi:beta-lactamase regulating signal transducer with metallopeptidase domain